MGGDSGAPRTAPFPYFGGKRRAVDIVWPRFGVVENYVEPFCGSLAMLLGAPMESGMESGRVETVNDTSGVAVNFWRAVRWDPEGVARWADWPVTEADKEARHGWVVNRSERLRWCLQDPDFYDAKIAGGWVWGACIWIGGGWCLGRGPWQFDGVSLAKGRGGAGVARQIPQLINGGRGINRQIPALGKRAMGGINRCAGVQTRGEFIRQWFVSLAARLREVRITCGDWKRVVTPAVTTANGLTAVFLDPPYSAPGASRDLYREKGDEVDAGISGEVEEWCVKNGENRGLRIALCGYAGEHRLPGWRCVKGKATSGGYGNRSGNRNFERERIWFSPHCVGPGRGGKARWNPDGIGMKHRD